MLFFKFIHVLPIIVAGLSSGTFEKVASKYSVDSTILEGICRYESDSGRVKHHQNKNGTWDVGYCQNHLYYTGDEVPEIPSDRKSAKKAAKELKYWKHQHKRFCVDMVKETGECGFSSGKKWIGVKNCKKPHHYFSHYNHGFRVLSNNYGHKVYCFVENGFNRCSKEEWRKLKKDYFSAE